MADKKQILASVSALGFDTKTCTLTARFHAIEQGLAVYRSLQRDIGIAANPSKQTPADWVNSIKGVKPTDQFIALDRRAFEDCISRALNGSQRRCDEETAERLREARELLSMFVVANEEHPLLDQVDADSCEYQSAQMAGLIVNASMWLRPNSVAECMAAYRVSADGHTDTGVPT